MGFEIWNANGVYYSRNTVTGVVTSDVNAGPLIAAAVASGGGQQVLLKDGYYDYSLAQDIVLRQGCIFTGESNTELHFTSTQMIIMYNPGTTVANMKITGNGCIFVFNDDSTVQNVIATVTKAHNGAFYIYTNSADINLGTINNVKFIDCVALNCDNYGFLNRGQGEPVALSNIQYIRCKAIDCGAGANRIDDWVSGFDLNERSDPGTPYQLTNVSLVDCEASGCWESGYSMEEAGNIINLTMRGCSAGNNGVKPTPRYGYGFIIIPGMSLYSPKGGGNAGGLVWNPSGGGLVYYRIKYNSGPIAVEANINNTPIQSGYGYDGVFNSVLTLRFQKRVIDLLSVYNLDQVTVNGTPLTLNADGSATIQIQDDLNIVTAYVVEVPLSHSLSIASNLSGFYVMVNGSQKLVPYSEALPEGSYALAVPSNLTIDSDIYNFTQWADGPTSPTRTIQLTADTPLTATYTKQAPPPPAKGNIEIHAHLDETEVIAAGTVVETAETFNTPATIPENPGIYTMKVQIDTQTKQMTANVVSEQTIRLDFQFTTPTPISLIPILITGELIVGVVTIALSSKGKGKDRRG